MGVFDKSKTSKGDRGMKKFSLIIPCYRHAEKLTRCIASIQDQDWENKEIIVVLDGLDKAAENVLKKYPDVKVLTIEHGGAPKARNEGAKIATGDYLEFLDADMSLYPGALRTFAETFDDNPDCGFVYGGYKYLLQGFYPSDEFDPYFLEINNYIDGNFPMRKEVFIGWDENCKSLQDWEMWLRMVKKGTKGYFLKDQYFFEKDSPPVDSISHDSHTHWLERKAYVQKKLDLPVRNVTLASLAAPHHAKRVAKILNYDYCDMFHLTRKPHNYKAILLIGWFPTQAVESANIFTDMTIIPKRARNVKKMIYWIGTDVLQMSMLPIGHKVFKGLVDQMNKEYIQFCQPLVEKELKDMGFNVINMPLPVEVEKKDIPFPKDFTVAIYDHGRNDMYNYPIMESIAKATPDIKYVFFGNHRMVGDTDVKNIRFLGHIPIDKVIAQSSVLLRITKHDGYPVSPIEFLNAGRVTITNQDMSYMIRAHIDLEREKGVIDGKKRIIKEIRRLKKKYATKEFIDEAVYFYKNMLDPRRLRKVIEDKL